MATIFQTKSKIDEGFACPSDEGRIFEKHLDFDSLSKLTNSELDEWINDYVSHLPDNNVNDDQNYANYAYQE